MFQLEEAIDQWCRAITHSAKSTELFDEVCDHLWCEVEKRMANGLDEKEAFQQATQQLDRWEGLQQASAQQQSLLNILCSDNYWNERYFRRDVMNDKQFTRLTLTQSILWATTLLVSALLLKDHENYHAFFMLLISISTVSIISFPGFKQAAKAECRWIKRKLKK